jgi:hypothetical protein
MQPQTEPTLPSVTAARSLLAGEPGSGMKLINSLLLRAAIVAPALYLTGTKNKWRLALQTAAVVGAIEVVVIANIARQVKAQRALQAGTPQ